MSCTDEDTGKLIGSYELGLLGEDERRRFDRHLLECEDCFESLYRTAPLAHMMREGKVAPAGRMEIPADEARDGADGAWPRTRRPRRFPPRAWYTAASAALAATLLIVLAARLLGPGEPGERLRGRDDVSILVLAPVGDVTAPTELRWKPVAEVESYTAAIRTATGELIWEASVKGTHTNLPDSVRAALEPGRTYTWQVEAVTAAGNPLKSGLTRFTIRR